ncbi:RNA recognition motif domain-containing protein [Algisphaera agarilytica]|uniref:RNA recognition motif-containing protein n=1 Tax=Algisphaera agarilytica TaxID=1385975 RepID=A0A7X0LLN2_9BACT|nr:RNA-binding protein [Algisphaera agarilytica]MBB6430143.1 RNA recognition motif-containing protein [Algisphaera agarilytica]
MTNIYVGNLPYSVEEEDLVEYFKQWGPVERATLVFDRETGRPRGFGFVEMDDAESAQKAIEEAHGKEFQGRPLTVNEARPRGSGRGNTSGYATRGNKPQNFSSPTPQPPAQNGYSNQSPTPMPPRDTPRSSDTPSQSPGGAGYSNQVYQ